MDLRCLSCAFMSLSHFLFWASMAAVKFLILCPNTPELALLDLEDALLLFLYHAVNFLLAKKRRKEPMTAARQDHSKSSSLRQFMIAYGVENAARSMQRALNQWYLVPLNVNQWYLTVYSHQRLRILVASIKSVRDQ